MSLFNKLDKFGKKKAIVSNNKEISYFELENFFKKNNIFNKNSLVLLLNDNSIESVMLYVLLMKSKNVCLMLIENSTYEKSISEIHKNYQHDYIILPKEKFKFFNNGFNALTEIGHFIVLKNKKNKIKNINKHHKLLLTTSGSLGTSKFVSLSIKNLKFNSIQIVDYLNIKNNDNVVTTMPMSYSYMLSIINTHLETGATIFINQNSIFQREFWDYFKEKKINSFSGVPYHFQILEKNNFKFLETNYLKYITCAGGSLDQKIIKKIHNFCIKEKVQFYSMYGQTEASPRISYLPYNNLKEKPLSIGRGLKGTKIWLEDENGKKIKTANKIGELVCAGKNVSNGYCNSRKDLTKIIKKNKFLKTGDLAYYDEDKFFFICGRKSRIAKIFGIRINLDELEKKMYNEYKRVICKSEGNKIYFFVKNKINKKKLMEVAEKITMQNRSAFEIIILNKFPTTNSGKIKYSSLKINENRL